jgi:hypothetical protein
LNRISSPEIDIIRRYIAKGLMIPPTVVVRDKCADLSLKFCGRFPHDQVNPSFGEADGNCQARVVGQEGSPLPHYPLGLSCFIDLIGLIPADGEQCNSVSEIGKTLPR